MGFTLNQLEQERQIRKLQNKEDKDTKDYEQLSHLPKINDIELKGNKTTSDLGINADNVMMSDGVTSVEEKIGNVRMTKLWENPSPSTSFAAQDVTLSSNDYDYLLFIGSNVGNTKTMASGIVEKGKSGYLCLNTYESTKVVYLGRDITCVNNTKYNIGDCLYITGSSSAVQNTYMVPVIIYGIKLT